MTDCAFRQGAYYAVFFLRLHAVFGQRFRDNSIWSVLRSPINLAYFISFACVTAVSDHDFIVLCQTQSSQNWVIDLVRISNAFLHHDDEEPLQFYATSLDTGVLIGSFALYLVEILCVDSILVSNWTHPRLNH